MRVSLLLVAVVLSAGNILRAQAAAPPAQKPNVLFILADDLGYGDVSCFNPDSKIKTAHIDRLASQGIRFTDAHAAGAVCVPSRYGLITGRYPFRNSRVFAREALIEPERLTLPGMLKKAGYSTEMIGKWHLSFDGGGNAFDNTRPLRGGPADRGFDRFFGMHASLDIPPYFFIDGTAFFEAPTARIEEHHSDDFTPIQGQFWRAGAIAPSFKMDQVLPTYTRRAVERIGAMGGGGGAGAGAPKPFFLYVALTAPHTPWLPTEPFRGKSGAGIYGDFVLQVDDAVGQILAALDKAGLADKTLVFFTSDNGPVWYDADAQRFGGHRSAHVYRGMKGDAWEGGHRMPLVVRWPGKVAAGGTSSALIGLTDVMATLAEITGQSLPEGAGEDSLSFLPALLGQGGDKGRDSLIAQSSQGVLAIRQGAWKLIPQLGSGGFTKPARIAPKAGEPRGQLYDLASDPGERTNLYDKQAEISRRLTELLEQQKSKGRSRP